MSRGRRSLAKALPLSQSLIIIVVVGALFIFSYTLVDRYVVRQKMGDLMNLADAKYVHVLDLLDLGQRLTHSEADNVNIRKGLASFEKSPSSVASKDLTAEVNRIRTIGLMRRRHSFGLKPLTRSRFHAVSITDKTGRIVASTQDGDVGRSLEKKAWDAGRKKETIVDPSRQPDGDIYFTFVSPIYSEGGNKGEFLGVLANQVDTRLLTMIMNADLGNVVGGKLFFAGFQYRSLDLYIMDGRGRFITQSRVLKSPTPLNKMGSALPLRRTLDVKSGGERLTNVGISTGAREAMDIYENRQHVMVAGASMPIYERDWTIVVEQPTRDAFAGLLNLERALVIGGILAVVLAAIASWSLSRRIVDSLTDLDAAAVALASGNFGRRPITRDDEYREIASLSGSFDLLRENVIKNLRAMREANARLHENETATKKAIDDLLEFARPRELTIGRESLSDIIDEAIALIGPPANISVRKNYDPSNLEVEIDRTKMGQAIANVLNHAVSVMPSGGSLTITTRPLPEGNGAEISIADTGVNVEPQAVARLFEPTFTTMTPNIGFGFPMTKAIVERHGGAITVAGQHGAGTVVDIKLPLRPRRAA